MPKVRSRRVVLRGVATAVSAVSTIRGPRTTGGPQPWRLRMRSSSDEKAYSLFRSAASHEPPQAYHFIRGPRNVLTDSPDAFTVAVESLMDVNDTND
ncbi:hypothetical protein EVAR_80981_1 [Eumeta japonica]|uniref:Uncharacterized protein n=1 Tax=Eumeta variegata TaxID=151549 RepID=A0A4C1WRS4_EUMVA|nr:hypothetical protein EVAR_80981_1 [Eumeta japonica]